MSERSEGLIEALRLLGMLSESIFGVSKDLIRDEFGWQDRKIERTISALERVLGEIRREKGEDGRVRYRVAAPVDLARTGEINRIKPAELADLRAAIEIVGRRDPMHRNLEELARKIGSALARDERNKMRDLCNMEDVIMASGTASAPRPHIKYDLDIMDKLQRAVLGYQQVRIAYKERRHNVCPLGFLYGQKNNYLIAEKEKYTCSPVRYILEAIESVDILEKTFDAKDFDIQKLAAGSFGVYQTNKGGYDVKWRVSAKAAPDARRYIFHPTQKIRENKDGTLTITFHADGLCEMAWHLFTWDGEIVPLAPAELVHEYRQMLDTARAALK